MLKFLHKVNHPKLLYLISTGFSDKSEWFIQATCAITGEGVYEGMKKMADMVKEKKKSRI